jgi:hypothetical protein
VKEFFYAVKLETAKNLASKLEDSQAWWYTTVIPALRRQRQVGLRVGD